MALNAFRIQSDVEMSSALSLAILFPSGGLKGVPNDVDSMSLSQEEASRPNHSRREKGVKEQNGAGFIFAQSKRISLFLFMYHMPSFLRCGSLSPSVIRLIRFHGVCLSGSL